MTVSRSSKPESRIPFPATRPASGGPRYRDWTIRSDFSHCNFALYCFWLPYLSSCTRFQASTEPGEGNSGQTLYWQTSGDGGLKWAPPRRILSDVTAPDGSVLPAWSPVLHVEVTYPLPPPAPLPSPGDLSYSPTAAGSSIARTGTVYAILLWDCTSPVRRSGGQGASTLGMPDAKYNLAVPMMA